MLQLYVAIAILAVCFYLKWQCSYWSRRNIKGPSAIPFFGNMWQYFIMKKHFGEVYDQIYKEYAGAAYVGFYKFSSPAILVRSLDLTKSILVDNFNSFYANDVFLDHKLDPLFAHNPFFTNTEQWKTSRSELSPLFTAVKLRSIFPLVSDVCDKLLRFLETKSGEDLEAKSLGAKFTIETVASVAFGLEADAFADHQSVFVENTRKVFEINTIQTIRFAIALFFPTIGKIMRLRFLPESVDHWIRSIIRQVVDKRQINNERRNDLLQGILEAHSKKQGGGGGPHLTYNEDLVAGHSLTFLVEGNETSGILMSYSLYQLAKNPSVQRRVQDEIDEVLKNSDQGKLTDEGLQNLNYLDNTLHETLRINSVIFSMSRMCTSSFVMPPQFPGDREGVTVEPGTAIIIPVYAMHMDPEVYENPTKFNPDRFTESGKSARHKHSFFGFGDGPRLCPGLRYGMMQTKAAIATILSKYNVEVSPKTIEPLSFSKKTMMLTCEDGIWIRFVKRTSV